MYTQAIDAIEDFSELPVGVKLALLIKVDQVCSFFSVFVYSYRFSSLRTLPLMKTFLRHVLHER